jgi:hypothetical protein
MKGERWSEETAWSRAGGYEAEVDNHGDELDMLALFALGSLPPDEETAIIDHLDTGCARCSGALTIFARVAAALGMVIAALPPSVLGNRRIKRDVRTFARVNEPLRWR